MVHAIFFAMSIYLPWCSYKLWSDAQVFCVSTIHGILRSTKGRGRTIRHLPAKGRNPTTYWTTYNFLCLKEELRVTSRRCIYMALRGDIRILSNQGPPQQTEEIQQLLIFMGNIKMKQLVRHHATNNLTICHHICECSPFSHLGAMRKCEGKKMPYSRNSNPFHWALWQAR